MGPDEIRAWRQRLGYSKRGAARALKVSPAYIHYLETGQRKPSETLQAFMQCLEDRDARQKAPNR